MRTRVWFAGALVVSVLFAGSSIAYATASQENTNPEKRATGERTSELREARQEFFGESVRGEITVRDGGQPGGVARTSFFAGEISAVDNGSVTVRGGDGVEETFELTSETRVRVDRRPGSAAELEPDMRALVLSRQAEDGSYEVRAVVARA